MRLGRNIIANYFGQGWIAIINIAFVPIYIKYLGVEAYGLIGVFAILQAWFGLLDMGIGQTLNREMARFLAGERSNSSIRDLLRSLEIIIGCIVIFVVISIWFASEWLSVHWLNTDSYAPKDISRILILCGLIISLRICVSLYKAILLGLQQQVLLNATNVVFATVRAVGVICVLTWIESSVEIFFIWQGIISVIEVIVFIPIAYNLLPKTSRLPKFSVEDLSQIRVFTGNIILINITQILLTYSDKIILSTAVSLEVFGFYALAGTVSQLIYQVTIPVSQACYPKLSELYAAKNHQDLIRVYRVGSQLISAVIVPLALMLSLFGYQIIFLWSGDEVLAENVAPICSLLAIGTMLNSIMHMPGILTLAFGWSQYGVRQNLVGIICTLPILPLIAQSYGAIGVAWLWVFLNIGYVLFGIQYIHSRLIPQEKWNWYLYSLISPIFVALFFAIFFYLIKPQFTSDFMEWFWFAMVASALIFITGLSQPILRQYFFMRVFSNEGK